MGVFVYHCIFLLSLPPNWLAYLIRTPVGLLLYGGHQAVILFFLLSGFVLFQPYARGRSVSPAAFIVKRVCRIYLPYLGALVFFVFSYLVFFRAQRPAGLSELYSWRPLTHPALLTLIRDHILFLGFFHRDYLNGATWTLAEEMRISLIFPFLAWFVLRCRTRTALLSALGCSIVVSVAIHLLHHRTPFEPFHYASLFVLGAVLASRRLDLITFWQRIGRRIQTLIACVAVLCAGYALMAMQHFPRLVTEEAADWVIALSVAVFLIAALADTWFTRMLRHKITVYLGTISYGIYLLHLPVLFVLVNLLWTHVPAFWIFGLALALTLALAQLFYVYLERPSMALGKRLAHAIERSPEMPARLPLAAESGINPATR